MNSPKFFDASTVLSINPESARRTHASAKRVEWVDTHTHVQLVDFNDDKDAVIRRALDAGVWMINVGTDFESSKKAVELAHRYPEGVYAAVGLHPNDVSPGIDFSELACLAEDEKVVGIGETGLDYFRTEDKEKQELQKEFFVKHLELAQKLRKPLSIHCRSAHEDLITILKANSSKLTAIHGVMHFFGGEGAWEHKDEYLKMGFYLSFSGVVTFSSYDHTEDIATIPLDRILIETDAPFATPVPYRGKRNEPVYVIETAKKLAEIRGLSTEELAKTTTENAKKLFSL